MIGSSWKETFGVALRLERCSSALDERRGLRIGDADGEREIFGDRREMC